MFYLADMAELADAEDLKSSDFQSCGFKPHYPYCHVSIVTIYVKDK